MNSAELLPLIESFDSTDDHERIAKEQTLNFLETTPGIPWSRKNFEDGHVCASAWVLNHDGTKALLFNHKKLGKWIQIGGHIEEGDSDFFAAVVREIQEETGLIDIEYKREIFDIDVHVYPPKGDEPEHIHYDLRILARANEGAETVVQEDEGSGLKWVPLFDIQHMNTDESVMHTARKAERFVAKLDSQTI